MTSLGRDARFAELDGLIAREMPDPVLKRGRRPGRYGKYTGQWKRDKLEQTAAAMRKANGK